MHLLKHLRTTKPVWFSRWVVHLCNPKHFQQCSDQRNLCLCSSNRLPDNFWARVGERGSLCRHTTGVREYIQLDLKKMKKVELSCSTLTCSSPSGSSCALWDSAGSEPQTECVIFGISHTWRHVQSNPARTHTHTHTHSKSIISTCLTVLSEGE